MVTVFGAYMYISAYSRLDVRTNNTNDQILVDDQNIDQATNVGNMKSWRPESIPKSHDFEFVSINNRTHQLSGATDNNTAIVKSMFVDRDLFVNTTGEIAKHKILFWNPPGWMINWFSDTDMTQCNYKNCKISYDQREFFTSKAVVYSIPDAGMDHRPPVSPAQRNPDQAWIFFTLESPVHLVRKEFRSPHWHNTFNWSWTYRTDSDIFHPYGLLKTRTKLLAKNYTEIFNRKTKMAAWAVSHCSTYSVRERFVQLLSRHVKVDIYGKCGLQPPQDLDAILDNDYTFYLGFENSFCQDYMTEKLFQYYKRDLITVVRGSMGYAKYLPQETFVNAADFRSVKELGEFLNRLSNNEDEYIEYLRRKDSYEVYEREYVFRDAMCNICDKINNLEKYRKVYKNIIEWLGNCYSANDLN
ncbi:3-galactosyl-N-acetylglucosaminide 4-alpha-L-fucosyltransferase FUT3-like [Dreissena polymorpha]|nr:3-galactosyl-N-acetylglucosaminide 4-alpha-L-fucosyltransferase FUT3-like [Dreissena polymorpha]